MFQFIYLLYLVTLKQVNFKQLKNFVELGTLTIVIVTFFSLYDVEIDELYCKDFNQFQELRSRNLKIINRRMSFTPKHPIKVDESLDIGSLNKAYGSYFGITLSNAIEFTNIDGFELTSNPIITYFKIFVDYY